MRAFSAILVVVIFLFTDAVHVQQGAFAAAPGDLDKIAKTYKIEIVTADPSFPVRTTHGTIDGEKAGRKELQNYISLFAPEFVLYPPDIVRRSQLKRVVLCTELSFAGQRINGIPDYEHDTIYLDVRRWAYNKTYLRKVIHHEFFHIIDYRDDGSVYNDERWASLNPANVRYGSGGMDAQELQGASVLTDKFPGFLNHYSTTGVEEDKAEVFANLIVQLDHVEDRAKKDRVLNAKVERMKELLIRFSPEMNDEFWKKVRKMKRADQTPGWDQEGFASAEDEIRLVRRSDDGGKLSALAYQDGDVILMDYDYVELGDQAMQFRGGEFGIVYREEPGILLFLAETGAIGGYRIEEGGRLVELDRELVEKEYLGIVVSNSSWGRGLVKSDFEHEYEDGGSFQVSVILSESGQRRLVVFAKNSTTNVSRLYVYEEGELRVLYFTKKDETGKVLIFNESEEEIAAFERVEIGVLRRLPSSGMEGLGGIWDRNW